MSTATRRNSGHTLGAGAASQSKSNAGAVGHVLAVPHPEAAYGQDDKRDGEDDRESFDPHPVPDGHRPLVIQKEPAEQRKGTKQWRRRSSS